MTFVDAGCQVWWASGADDTGRLLAVLDAAERARWAQLRHPAGRRAYLAAHATARLVIGEMLGVEPHRLRFSATCRGCGGPHGKPVLSWPAEPVHLSLSHSGEVCAVAVSGTAEIGVDVEQVRLRGDRIPVRVLSGPERAVLEATDPAERLPVFIRYWARKEAILKATGDGLAVDPARVTVTAPGEPPALLHWAGDRAPDRPLRLVDLHAPAGYVATLATLNRSLAVTELDATPLLARR